MVAMVVIQVMKAIVIQIVIMESIMIVKVIVM